MINDREQKAFLPQSDIRTMWGPELESSPESLKGSIAVVIDVLATSHNTPNFLGSDVEALYLVNDTTMAGALAKYPDAVVIGDIAHLHLPDDTPTFSNVPSALEEADALSFIEGKTILYRTNNGTRVAHASFDHDPEKVIFASFSNIHAVKEYLLKQHMPVVIIKAGEHTFGDKWQVSEDRICAETLSALLKGDSVNWDHVKEEVRRSVISEYEKEYIKAGRTLAQLARDSELVLQVNSTPIIPLCTVRDELIHVRDVSQSS